MSRAAMRSLSQSKTSARTNAMRFGPKVTACGNSPRARFLLIAVRLNVVSLQTSFSDMSG